MGNLPITPELVAAAAGALMFLLIAVVIIVVRGRGSASERAVKERLEGLAMAMPDAQSIDIVRRESLSDVAFLDKALAKTTWAQGLGKLISQADAPGNPGMYVIFSCLFGLGAFYACWIFLNDLLLTVALTALGASLPLLWLKRAKNKRMNKFQEQLPDALDLVGRAMRAGHTFGGGLRMVADEFENPIGEEFRITMEEINLGIGVDTALANLLNRVDCNDLKFFVVSVNVQRETGGNLAEIIGNIAGLVRERFKLKGRVSVLSAEGRMSAYILLALPFIITFVLWLLNPEYMSTLFNTPQGHSMLKAACGTMAFGAFVIRRMIKIKV